jgi:hypothetical protein
MYNESISPMTKMAFHRKTCYNIKPQIISTNLPSAFEFPRDMKKKRSHEAKTEEKLVIIKEFKNSTDLADLKRKYRGPSTVYNYMFEQMKNKIEKQDEMKVSQYKTKKVILKPIEIKDPRVYFPSSTNLVNEAAVGQKGFGFKNRLYVEEMKESSPLSEKFKAKFAKTTYVDYEEQFEGKPRLLNNPSMVAVPADFNTSVVVKRTNYKMRLDEMITLKVMKRNKNWGVVKKMLHASSLRIYVAKVESFKIILGNSDNKYKHQEQIERTCRTMEEEF